MIQIALIAGTYAPERCGVAHYTARLRDQLSHRNVESIVLTTHEATVIPNPGIQPVVRRWHLTELLPLVQAIHATQADILHIQHAAGTYGFNRAIFLLPLLMRITGWSKPIVTTVHEYGWWEWQPRWVPTGFLERLKTWGQQRGWWDREDGFLLTQSDAIITTNGEAEQVLYDRLPHLKQRIHRIPIGANVKVAEIDRTIARYKLRQDCGWPDDAMIVAFFGFLHPVKGLETLLPAFKQVLAVQPQARLLLIGGVESLALPREEAKQYWDKLQRTIADLGLESTVHKTGYLDPAAVSHCLTGADLGVLPFNHGVTLKSGSLLALLAHGLPVVATRANPLDPNLAKESWVRAIAPRHLEELATALIKLLADPELRSQLGAAGRQYGGQFDWFSIADAHLDIYQTVISQASSVAAY